MNWCLLVNPDINHQSVETIICFQKCTNFFNCAQFDKFNWCIENWLSMEKISNAPPQEITSLSLLSQCISNPFVFYNKTKHQSMIWCMLPLNRTLDNSLSGLVGIRFTHDCPSNIDKILLLIFKLKHHP